MLRSSPFYLAALTDVGKGAGKLQLTLRFSGGLIRIIWRTASRPRSPTFFLSTKKGSKIAWATCTLGGLKAVSNQSHCAVSSDIFHDMCGHVMRRANI